MGKKRNTSVPYVKQVAQANQTNLFILSTYKAFSLTALYILLEKCEITKEQLETFVDGMNDSLDSVGRGYIESASDFEEVLAEEYGIVFDGHTPVVRRENG